MKRSEMIKKLAAAIHDNFNGIDELSEWEWLAPDILAEIEKDMMPRPSLTTTLGQWEEE